MRLVAWAIRLVLFLLLVAFAAKNAAPVTLHFYFDLALDTPLVVALFAAFALGALFGVTALVGTLLRQRREIGRLRRRVPPEEPARDAAGDLTMKA
ncbi:MAG TPA: lipopolysaccharide assembly protein LapA domain-containing protein [Burkholderiales bacterium]|nr:lipopolysaccharide assembly protein LapA domain-containing protein [Burkholderiales bacterium]